MTLVVEIPNARICAQCGVEFTARAHQQKYCSDQCRHRVENIKRRDKKNAWNRAKYAEDPAQFKARHDRWFWANREYVRGYRRKSLLREKYGLTPEQVETMLMIQHGLCALCGGPLPKRFHIDHNHKTGVIRGLLHDQCNRGLSLFGDDLERLRQAVAYLETR